MKTYSHGKIHASSIKQWFLRANGEWNSNRRYWYAKSDKNQVLSSKLGVNVEDTGEDTFKVSLTWDRNIGYMTTNETASKVSLIDSDTVLLETEYSGMKFREEIRLLGDDIRLRQTVGWKEDSIILVGQYFEQRLRNSLPVKNDAIRKST